MVDIIFEIHLRIGEDFPIRAEDLAEHQFMPVDACCLHSGKRTGPDLPFIFESVPELHRRKIALSTGIQEKQEKDQGCKERLFQGFGFLRPSFLAKTRSYV
jgi:hypothetical protein